MKKDKKHVYDHTDDEVMNLPDFKLDNHNKKVVFIRNGMPGEWLSYAEELMDSAELLWKNKEMRLRVELSGTKNNAANGIIINDSRKVAGISRSYFLFVGFAIENLFKGLIVYQDPKNITEGKLSSQIKSHKILALADKIIDIELTNKERKICKNIEKAIPYWGRYPIPLDSNGITPDIGVTEEIRNTIKGMFERISLNLYSKIRDGWNSGSGAKLLKYRSERYGDRIDLKENLFE